MLKFALTQDIKDYTHAFRKTFKTIAKAHGLNVKGINTHYKLWFPQVKTWLPAEEQSLAPCATVDFNGTEITASQVAAIVNQLAATPEWAGHLHYNYAKQTVSVLLRGALVGGYEGPIAPEQEPEAAAPSTVVPVSAITPPPVLRSRTNPYDLLGGH